RRAHFTIQFNFEIGNHQLDAGEDLFYFHIFILFKKAAVEAPFSRTNQIIKRGWFSLHSGHKHSTLLYGHDLFMLMLAERTSSIF
ncbi:MAG: hypothetical protein ACKO2S_02925, partial [Burkholderiaceae bacterium]